MNKEEAIGWASKGLDKLSDYYQIMSDSWESKNERELSKRYEDDIFKMQEALEYIEENLK